MSFKKFGMMCRGLEVGGYSVAKYACADSSKKQLRLMRNGRAVARKTFENGLDFSVWFTATVPSGTDRHDTIVKLTEELRK